jgi:hypothetical protein
LASQESLDSVEDSAQKRKSSSISRSILNLMSNEGDQRGDAGVDSPRRFTEAVATKLLRVGSDERRFGFDQQDEHLG